MIIFGYPAYSHHDKIPPWWGNVNNEKVGMCQCQIPTTHDKLQLEQLALVSCSTSPSANLCEIIFMKRLLLELLHK